MNYIENDAIENNCDSIRLDTFSMNKKNNNFYSNIGYENLDKYILETKVICLSTAMKSA